MIPLDALDLLAPMERFIGASRSKGRRPMVVQYEQARQQPAAKAAKETDRLAEGRDYRITGRRSTRAGAAVQQRTGC